jgi:hypothetical protein
MLWDVPIEGVGWESMLDVIFERERNESVSAGLSLSLSSSKIDRRGGPRGESKGFDIGLESQSQLNEFEEYCSKHKGYAKESTVRSLRRRCRGCPFSLPNIASAFVQFALADKIGCFENPVQRVNPELDVLVPKFHFEFDKGCLLLPTSPKLVPHSMPQMSSIVFWSISGYLRKEEATSIISLLNGRFVRRRPRIPSCYQTFLKRFFDYRGTGARSK